MPTALPSVISSAIGLTLAFPPASLSFLGWVALVPLIIVVNTTGPGRAYLAAGLGGLVFFAGFFSWIWAVPDFNLVHFIVLELYFAQYFALFGVFLNIATHRARIPAAVAAPVLWVSLEYCRSHLSFLALPMALLGHSQYRQLPLIQVASITGVYGLSFLTVLVNAVVADLLGLLSDSFKSTSPGLDRRGRARLVALLGTVLVVPGAVVLYGTRVLALEPDADRIRVGVLQQDLPPRIEAEIAARTKRLDGLLQMSRRLAADHPQLIVWPETAVVGPLRTTPNLLAPIASLAQSTDSYVLLGTVETLKFGSTGKSQHVIFNSAVLISPIGKVEGVYDKIRLVPFGEYRPLAGIVAWPKWLLARADQLTPGSEHAVFRLPTARFGVVICWESLFPDLVSTLVRRGADFVVNITNESWFGATVAPEQLAAISVFRAVEHNITLVRSANGGISAFIDPQGRVTARVRPRDRHGAYGEGALAQTIALPRRLTFYTRHGDVMVYVCLGAAVVIIGLALMRPSTAS